TVVPLKQFQRLLGHKASAATVMLLGLLCMRPLQHWLHSRVPRWAWRRGTHRVTITPLCRRLFNPCPDLAFLRAGVPSEQVSRHVVVTTDASSTGWGATCNGQAVLDRTSTALAHQLPRVVDSAPGLVAVLATAARQARVGPYGQHCGCIVYQPAGRCTITSHVTARPSSPPLESDVAEITACCLHPGEAQLCGQHALTTAHVPRKMATPSPDCPADLKSIRGSPGRPVRFSRVLPLPAILFPDQGVPQCRCSGTQLAAGARMLLPTAPPWRIPLRQDLLSQGLGTMWHLWDGADLSDLPPAVVETITQARTPSTRQAYALK
ncbi:hypothetical protein M9458_033210, partial [Cirrhinus mrigala]